MTRRTRRTATVLVIATPGPVRDAWARALEANHHAVVASRSVEPGVAHAREGGIDVVVFDATDRAQDGRLLVDELDRLPEPPPLILVSSSPRAPELSARLGAAAFVPTPCEAADIVDECERLLASRSLAFDDEPTGPRELVDP
ncbi:MAG: hypothetical protein R3B06_01910 [Kofleriaceae bacterium]